jgi:hypothetical protein
VDEKAVLLVPAGQYTAKVRVRSHMLVGGEYCRGMGRSCGRDPRPGYEFTLAAFALGGELGPAGLRRGAGALLLYSACALVRSIRDVSGKGI